LRGFRLGGYGIENFLGIGFYVCVAIIANIIAIIYAIIYASFIAAQRTPAT
jgi:hypothetical protein